MKLHLINKAAKMTRINDLYNDEKYYDVELSGVKFHKCMLCQIEYFANTFQWQKEILEFKITEECAKLFKKWLYEQPILQSDINSLELGIEIFEMSRYLSIQFYTEIKNMLFVYVLESNDSNIQFEYFKTFSVLYDERFKITSYQVDTLDKLSYAYACCLNDGIGCVQDEKTAFELYKLNWEQNKNSDSLHMYAYYLLYGIECIMDEQKAFELFKMNWEQNKNSSSLYNYAYCCRNGIGCVKNETTAFELYKINCEQNKDRDSIHNYAYCYENGSGCVKDEKKAFELYKMNWEQNKHSGSLHNYAYCLRKGSGCVKDEKTAFELYKMNWEQNQNKTSLCIYIDCLEQGIGCERNLDLATVLKLSL